MQKAYGKFWWLGALVLPSLGLADDAYRSTTLELGIGVEYLDLPGIQGSGAAVTDANRLGPSLGNPVVSR